MSSRAAAEVTAPAGPRAADGRDRGDTPSPRLTAGPEASRGRVLFHSLIFRLTALYTISASLLVLLDMHGGRQLLGAQEITFRIVDGAGNTVLETPGMARELAVGAFPPAVDPGSNAAHGLDVVNGSHAHRLLTIDLRSTILGGA